MTSHTRPDVPIRRAMPDDATALAAFGSRLFAETFGAANRPDDIARYLAATYGPAHQTRELADPSLTYLVAEADGTMAGFVLLRSGATPASVVSPRPLEILRFYVDRPFQGAGVSRALMAECVAEARRRGATALWLGVWERNARAIRFYEKSGFRDVGSQDFMLGSDRQIDLVMLRDL